MAEYIEREAAKRLFADSHNYGLARKLDEIPAADVVPMEYHERCLEIEIQKRLAIEPKHGRWIIDKSFLPFVCTCSVCGWSTDTDGAFEWKGCPDCLARMDGDV